ncbi:DUF2835 domain-containing protein [Motiliproteus sediminis]|uniref:DUF2835 domain-containing protein n=1 Tax=Motiliproteus sediminis TaxID=1468178 RepID=UPI001AEF4C7E
MQQIIVDIRISPDEYLRYYRGEAGAVSCRARDGRRVRFPAALLRPYVGRDGIYGSFSISYDSAGKFQRIDKIA